MLPFVLRGKLTPDLGAPFFEAAGDESLHTDRIGWLRRLSELICAEYDRLDLAATIPWARGARNWIAAWKV